jgi:hypothetical protein
MFLPTLSREYLPRLPGAFEPYDRVVAIQARGPEAVVHAGSASRLAGTGRQLSPAGRSGTGGA